jgi:hypothetical protein
MHMMVVMRVCRKQFITDVLPSTTLMRCEGCVSTSGAAQYANVTRLNIYTQRDYCSLSQYRRLYGVT